MDKKKKSYNPFKMWGSYVGVFLAILLLFLIIPQINNYVVENYYPYDTPLDLEKKNLKLSEDFNLFERAISVGTFTQLKYEYDDGKINMVDGWWTYHLFIINLIILLSGFLIGYGIHSIVRVLRK